MSHVKGDKANKRSAKSSFRVSYVIRESQDLKRHKFGVNSFAQSRDGSHLYTAGRDGFIRRWNIPNKNESSSFSAVFEDHTDWVNDLVLCNDDSTLVSCSSDTTVKIWSTDSCKCVATLGSHKDFVKKLAYADQKGWVASAGLDSIINVWDLQSASVIQKLGNSSDDQLSSSFNSSEPILPFGTCSGHKDSIYSLAITENGRCIASGGPAKKIMLCDTRTFKKFGKLRGHFDSIRCLALSPDGTKCLSGSSDCSIKMWDIGMQRCIHTFDNLSSSIWTMCTTESFEYAYVGTRDGCVIQIDLVNEHEELPVVCQMKSSVLALSLSKTTNTPSIWASTTLSDIHQWPTPPEKRTETNPLTQSPIPPIPIVKPSSPTTSPYSKSLSVGLVPRSITGVSVASSVSIPLPRSPVFKPSGIQAISAIQSKPYFRDPLLCIRGTSACMHHYILNDRRHILTSDTNGKVREWSILDGKCVKDFDQADFGAICRSRFSLKAVPSWFSCDTKNGGLTIHLDAPNCFGAEIYSAEIGVIMEAEDAKVNIGAHVLQSLFRCWKEDMIRNDSNSKLEEEGCASGENGDTETPAKTTTENPAKTTTDVNLNLPLDTPIILSDRETQTIVRRASIESFRGPESADVLPFWLADCVLKDEYMVPIQKLIFFVKPAAAAVGPKLPALPEAACRLNAHRVLVLSRVAAYIIKQLGIDLPSIEEETVKPSEYLEFLCRGKVVPMDSNLGTVRHFFWKQGDELVLEYRVK